MNDGSVEYAVRIRTELNGLWKSPTDAVSVGLEAIRRFNDAIGFRAPLNLGECELGAIFAGQVLVGFAIFAKVFFLRVELDRPAEAVGDVRQVAEGRGKVTFRDFSI